MSIACTFITTTFDSQENEITWELEFDYTPGTPDSYWQPGDPPEGEIKQVLRNGDRFSGDVPEEVYTKFEQEYARIGDEALSAAEDDYWESRAQDQYDND